MRNISGTAHINLRNCLKLYTKCRTMYSIFNTFGKQQVKVQMVNNR